MQNLFSRDNRWLTVVILVCVFTTVALVVAAFTVDLSPLFQAQVAGQ